MGINSHVLTFLFLLEETENVIYQRDFAIMYLTLRLSLRFCVAPGGLIQRSVRRFREQAAHIVICKDGRFAVEIC
jgi:hypothetical protein